MIIALSMVLSTVGVTGLWLAGRRHWTGWALGLAVQPVWAVFAVATHAYPLLASCLAYGAVNAHNLWKWKAS